MMASLEKSQGRPSAFCRVEGSHHLSLDYPELDRIKTVAQIQFILKWQIWKQKQQYFEISFKEKGWRIEHQTSIILIMGQCTDDGELQKSRPC